MILSAQIASFDLPSQGAEERGTIVNEPTGANIVVHSVPLFIQKQAQGVRLLGAANPSFLEAVPGVRLRSYRQATAVFCPEKR